MGKGLEAGDDQCVPSCLWKSESESGSNLLSPESMSPGFYSGRQFHLPDIRPMRALPSPPPSPIAPLSLQGLTLM